MIVTRPPLPDPKAVRLPGPFATWPDSGDPSILYAQMPLRDHDGYAVQARFQVSSGLHAEWIAVVAAPDAPGPITARMMRAVAMGDLERRLRQSVDRWGTVAPDGPVGTAPHEPTRQRFDMARSTYELLHHPGRSGRPDLPYAEIAYAYCELLKSTAHPIPALADEWGVSRGRVRNMLNQARERGLLTSRGRGLVGGDLTEKAKEVLRGEH